MRPMSVTVDSRHGDSPSVRRATMTVGERDLRRLQRASIFATILVSSLGAGVAVSRHSSNPGPRLTTPLTVSAEAAPVTNSEEFLAAVARRRERSSLPLLVNDPSLQTSAQGWADSLIGRGVGHDPKILDGVDDRWEQVAELVSSGPSFDAAARALLAKPAGSSPLDDRQLTAFGLGSLVDGDATVLVVRLLRTAQTGDVGVQMGF